MGCSRNKSGFTLVETLVSMGLLSLLVLVLFSLVLLEQRVLVRREVLGDDLRQLQSSLQRMELTVQEGQEVLESATVQGTSYATGLHTLVLELPAFDSAGNAIVGSRDLAAYTLSGTDLMEVMEPAAGSARQSGSFRLAEEVKTLNVAVNQDPVSDGTQVLLYVEFAPPAENAAPAAGSVRAALKNKSP